MSARANSDEELCQITNPAEKLKMLYILQIVHFSEQVLPNLMTSTLHTPFQKCPFGEKYISNIFNDY